MKRDLYAQVSGRIIAELEAGAAPWIKPWSATAGHNVPCNAVTNRPYSGCNVVLLWMAQAAGYRTPRYLTFKQALELGGHIRKGEHGIKVYFVKQLQVRDKGADDEAATRFVPMLREYTVFNVDQCDGLPDRVLTLGQPKRRNPDERDATNSRGDQHHNRGLLADQHHHDSRRSRQRYQRNRFDLRQFQRQSYWVARQRDERDRPILC
jgi:antirestriction protein ArdC